MRLAVLLFCCALAFGQNISSAPETQSQAPANSPDQKSQKQDYGLGSSDPERQLGALAILSDTQGVNFGPYLQRILQTVRENWYHLIPESVQHEKGQLAIEFAITKDGKVPDMRLVASSGNRALDRAAWGSITASNPFPPLPSEFTGPIWRCASASTTTRAKLTLKLTLLFLRYRQFRPRQVRASQFRPRQV
jgi:TonB family protein